MGSIIGGVVVLAIFAFIVWHFFIKPDQAAKKSGTSGSIPAKKKRQ